MPDWPRQRDCDAFYGNPRGSGGGHVSEKWYAAHIVVIPLPFVMHMGVTRITRISIHKLCAESLSRVLAAVGRRQAELCGDDMAFDGSYNYRAMRGARALSMHAYGCALDIDAGHNPFRKRAMRFNRRSVWVEEFERENWVWGGRWKSPDGMHFQAARV